ncbi:FtsK/SpoIIIE domain-containing protein [Promicromonospora panici]|uniref:FtsK/SpoIIIE domain-containing protein n=1 Tax=Promicromonospora panici TaxID=2219658 RepID=UPI00101CE935|nr:FtsK/SpoIIIE domain-containing protein [Promicromonospora panici]
MNTTLTGLRAALATRIASARAAVRASTVGRPGWSGRTWRVLAWIAYRTWMFIRGLTVWMATHALFTVLVAVVAFGWWGILTLAEVPGDLTTGPVLLALVLLSPGLVHGMWAAITPHGYLVRMHGRKMAASWPKVAAACGIGERQVGGEVIVPKLSKIRYETGATVLRIHTMPGQTLETLYRAAPAITTTYKAHGFSTTTVKPGVLDLGLFTTDRIAPATAASPRLEMATPDGLAVGRTRSGKVARLKVRGTHTLVVGATGAGKGSVLWSVVGGLAPAAHTGLVEFSGLDLKGGIELEMGRALFTRIAYESTDALRVLRELVAIMDRRKEAMRGKSRLHEPTPGDPLHVLVVDELADLMAYSDFETRREADRLMSKLLTQGRALGVIVVSCVQNPRQEAVGQRNLYPTKIALRLDSEIETDMVLGPAMALAPAHTILETDPGTAYLVREDGSPELMRFDYWPDDLIREVALRFAAPRPARAPSGSLPPSDADAVAAWTNAGRRLHAVDAAVPNDNGQSKASDNPTPRQRKPRKPRAPRAPRSPRPAAPAASTEEVSP